MRTKEYRETPAFQCQRYSQVHKDVLRSVLSQFRLPDPYEGRSIDQVHMPLHQFCETGFGAGFGVAPQQSLIRHYVALLISPPRPRIQQSSC